MQATIGANGTNNYGTAGEPVKMFEKMMLRHPWNLGWGWNTPTQHLVDAWDPTDPRKNKTILFSGQSDGGLPKADMELRYLLMVQAKKGIRYQESIGTKKFILILKCEHLLGHLMERIGSIIELFVMLMFY